MPVRKSLSFPLVPAESTPIGVAWVGHGCGPIAPVIYLVRHKELSVRVSRWYVDSILFPGDRECVASELYIMQLAGCKLCREARRLVGWWVRAGFPKHWG